MGAREAVRTGYFCIVDLQALLIIFKYSAQIDCHFVGNAVKLTGDNGTKYEIRSLLDVSSSTVP